MAMKTHKTRAGRIVVELDGCSDYYGGAMVQGAIVARFSVPASVDVSRAVDELPNCPNAGPEYIDAIREAVPGIRVYEWRRVQ